jgi:hypothetical protein
VGPRGDRRARSGGVRRRAGVAGAQAGGRGRGWGPVDLRGGDRRAAHAGGTRARLVLPLDRRRLPRGRAAGDTRRRRPGSRRCIRCGALAAAPPAAHRVGADALPARHRRSPRGAPGGGPGRRSGGWRGARAGGARRVARAGRADPRRHATGAGAHRHARRPHLHIGGGGGGARLPGAGAGAHGVGGARARRPARAA